MVRKELLDILVCPENHTRLSEAPTDLVQKLNEEIAAGRLRNRGGQIVEDKLDGGLIREDGTLLYPVQDNIPVMLLDEAIPLQLS